MRFSVCKEHIYRKSFNSYVLCWRCQVVLLGAEDFLASVEQEACFHSKTERKWKNGSFQSWAKRRGGINMVIYSEIERFSNLSIELKFMFPLIHEEYEVHSMFPCSYQLQIISMKNLYSMRIHLVHNLNQLPR